MKWTPLYWSRGQNSDIIATGNTKNTTWIYTWVSTERYIGGNKIETEIKSGDWSIQTKKTNDQILWDRCTVWPLGRYLRGPERQFWLRYSSLGVRRRCKQKTNVFMAASGEKGVKERATDSPYKARFNKPLPPASFHRRARGAPAFTAPPPIPPPFTPAAAVCSFLCAPPTQAPMISENPKTITENSCGVGGQGEGLTVGKRCCEVTCLLERKLHFLDTKNEET